MTTDYFKFFDLSPAPLIDVAELKKRYYAISRETHPDFFTLADDTAQEAALEKSTYNNHAYRTLLDPDTRLKYFLDSKGALAAEGENQVPQEFLLEMMDLNEALMELKMEPDPAAQVQLEEQIDTFATQLEEEIEPVRNGYDDATATPADLAALADYYLKRRYLRRLRQNLRGEDAEV
ncbi:MAG: Fe-S protein assembly co-chaperone HscB [Saprospiraceae bacterium]